MITNSRELELTTKQTSNDQKISKGSSSSTPWSRSKDPRIVRVSRAFGGKDRHSKVCTVRGLRDRRVRLSVPTAIQLYDLQDRLGLNQPSKVIDWLLNAAKHEIDELPPLQMPPAGNFTQIPQSMLSSHGASASQSNKEGLKINWDDPLLGVPKSNFWNNSDIATLRNKSKEVAIETSDEKQNWNGRNEEEKQHEGHASCVSSNQLFPRPNNSSLPCLPSHSTMPYNSFYRWDPSNFSLSNLGSHGFTVPRSEDLQNLNVLPLAPTLSLPSGSQVFVCPPAGTTHTYFPSHVGNTDSPDFDPKQNNHFHMLSSTPQIPLSSSLAPPLYSIGQSMRPFHLSMTSKLFPSQSNSESQSNKDIEFPTK